MSGSRTLKGGIVLLFIAVILPGCTGYSITGGPGSTAPVAMQSRTAKGNKLRLVNTVALLPVVFDTNISVKSSEALTSKINTEMDRILKEELGVDVYTVSQVEALRRGSKTKSYVEIARELGADATITMILVKYDERVGSAVGVDSAAAISFEIYAQRVTDGASVWEANYFYQDQALSENLFRIKERLSGSRPGKGWLTADAILDSGLREVARLLRQASPRIFQ